MKAPKRPTKGPQNKTVEPKRARKDDLIRVRVTGEQRAVMQAAADAAGLDLSSWLRMVGYTAAKTAATQSDTGNA